jgi:hypothetical protein
MSDDRDDLAEWRGNIESRVSTLEVTVKTQARVRAQMDRDMSDLNLKLDAQGRLLRALADTQSEHTAALAHHTAVLADHTVVLADHTAVLADHTAVLADHTVVLADHTARLTRLEVGQAKVLAGVQAIIGLLDRESGSLPE